MDYGRPQSDYSQPQYDNRSAHDGSNEASSSRGAHTQALSNPVAQNGGRGNQEEERALEPKPAKEGKGGASEFVKKLYRMLEDVNFVEIVCWGFSGDSFVVKDMNNFTRQILPLHFKHSNFASFVRQLNKYDFHKVKNADDGGSPYGEHTWEFKHPNFRHDMKSSLEHIKRKAPAPRKSTPTPAARGRASLPSDGGLDLSAFQAQMDGFGRTQSAMSQHMQTLTNDYHAVIGEMMNFQRNMVAQDQLMQNLIQYLVNLEADQKAADPSSEPTPFVPSSQAQKLISSYTEVARASYDQMADLSRRASISGSALPPMPLPPPGFGQLTGLPNGVEQGSSRGSGSDRDRERDVKPILDGPYHRPDSNYDSRDPRESADRQRERDHYAQQQQQQSHHHQQQHQQQHGSPHPSHAQAHHPQHHLSPQVHHGHMSQHSPSMLSGEHSNHSNSPDHSRSFAPPIQPRKPAYVPGWAVPPRVLLVEDDAVCRKLSSKFLQIFGCEIDVAVDGVSAVSKMNLQKYDLVLMDIVMPNLDGVSATSLIRQFDPMTPIISMTSNSGPNEIMTYFSHGMNDILPKPFTKEGLLGMLEKHLIHLKVMQQMAEIPRALGFTDNQIQDAVAVSTVSEEGTVINPFATMGISDADYVEMLQGIALEKEGKRGLEVVQGNEREGKRARFQEVEEPLGEPAS